MKKDSIKGEFTQIKHIAGFNKDIKSYGKFRLEKETLFWDSTKPFASSLKIDKNGIFELKDGEWIKHGKNYDKGLFLDILNLNTQNLKKNFDITLSGDKKSWILELTPKGAIIKKAISSISIKGGESIDEIEIIESNLDITKNIFKTN